jgi:hypothetical protein
MALFVHKSTTNTGGVTLQYYTHQLHCMRGKCIWVTNYIKSPNSDTVINHTATLIFHYMPEKDGEDQLDCSCEKWRSVTVNEQRNILHEIIKRKANWIGHILRRNCLLKQVTEGKIKGEIEVTGRWGRRRKKLLDDLKDRRVYSHLKEEALDHTIWRNSFGRGVGPVVRLLNEWM